MSPVVSFPRVRVLIAEDFPPFREYLVATLAKFENLQLICEVSDGLEAVQKAKELQPDLITLDVGLPSLNGIEAARQITKLLAHTKIIFVTQESSPDVVQDALRLGAQGYVLKGRAATDLVAAVDAVRKGGHFVSDGLIDR